MPYRVKREDLQKGAKAESKEHPWASETRARRIARDHLQKYGPGYYRAEPVNERVVSNINHKMHAKPIRKKRPSPPGMFYTDYRF
jgi:hypothetical protein